MRILMLGNSLTFSNDLPQMLAERTGAQVIYHTRGGARLSEQLNPSTRLGARTQAALAEERWDYVIMQEMSHGPITSPKSFFSSVERLCKQIQDSGAVPVLYATWAYQKDSPKLAAKGWDYDEMNRALSEAYHQAAQKNRALLADVGLHFYKLSHTQQLYAKDGVHPTQAGSRIAAQVIASTIQTYEEKRL
ncbi:SGNH/GDSL hydrolase family protein [uncultured Ruthenibacterium sp.]|uniref:SGNH/GDSL hydrolase family protein n=1 Tax=uncultured Ruthenibacterium sp. TaxID=1905347 RepID=UPI00349E670E